MPRTILSHLDENCTKSIAPGLRRHGIDVTTTPEAGLLGATDDEQAAYALPSGASSLLKTGTFRIHAAGITHVGIAYCEKDTRSIGETIDGMVLLCEVYEPEEIAGRVEYT